MSFLDKIRPFKFMDLNRFVRVKIDAYTIGWTKQELAHLLDQFNDTWVLREDGLHLNDAIQGYDDRTQAIDDTFNALSEAGHIPPLPDYSILGGIDWHPVFKPDRQLFAKIKRFYAPYLGTYFESVIVNGYHDGAYWAPRRGRYVEASPGKMDVLVAGTVLYDQTKEQALHDEAHCEAGVTEEWHRFIRPARELRLFYPNRNGYLMNERFFVYDFDTQGQFIPKTNQPAEVEGIYPFAFSEVMEMVQEGHIFKPQVNLVITDFLIRHGQIAPTHPEHDALRILLDEDKDFSA